MSTTEEPLPEPVQDLLLEVPTRTIHEAVRIHTLEAAADALGDHSHDFTGSASYNRRRAYEAPYDAAMAALRTVPVEHRPDGLVADVDEVCGLIRDREHSRDDVEAALREAAEEARR